MDFLSFELSKAQKSIRKYESFEYYCNRDRDFSIAQSNMETDKSKCFIEN